MLGVVLSSLGYQKIGKWFFSKKELFTCFFCVNWTVPDFLAVFMSTVCINDHIYINHIAYIGDSQNEQYLE